MLVLKVYINPTLIYVMEHYFFIIIYFFLYKRIINTEHIKLTSILLNIFDSMIQITKTDSILPV